jgi:transcriptional regulator with XRE-family HTH domain
VGYAASVTSGELLRQARLRAGLSQDELSERVGVHRSQIARWERDAVQPSLETIRQLVRACGFDLPMRLVPYDDSGDDALREALVLSPQERVARLLTRLEPPAPRQGR